MSRGVIHVAVGSAEQLQLLRINRRARKRYSSPLLECVVSDNVEKCRVDSEDDANFIEVPSAIHSRYVKTSINTYSPFDMCLFLDNDAIPKSDISALWSVLDKAPIAASLDIQPTVKQALGAGLRNRQLSLEEARDTSQICTLDSPYYNTGVLIWKSCQQTNEFFTLWHQEWLKFRHRDQYAFARALAISKFPIAKLPQHFNQWVFPGDSPDAFLSDSILHFWQPPKLDTIRRFGLDEQPPSIRHQK